MGRRINLMRKPQHEKIITLQQALEFEDSPLCSVDTFAFDWLKMDHEYAQNIGELLREFKGPTLFLGSQKNWDWDKIFSFFREHQPTDKTTYEVVYCGGVYARYPSRGSLGEILDSVTARYATNNFLVSGCVFGWEDVLR